MSRSALNQRIESQTPQTLTHRLSLVYLPSSRSVFLSPFKNFGHSISREIGTSAANTLSSLGWDFHHLRHHDRPYERALLCIRSEEHLAPFTVMSSPLTMGTPVLELNRRPLKEEITENGQHCGTDTTKWEYTRRRLVVTGLARQEMAARYKTWRHGREGSRYCSPDMIKNLIDQ